MKEKEENYQAALRSHSSKFTGKNSVNEGEYRESANKLRIAYDEYAIAMRQAGTPIPVWL